MAKIFEIKDAVHVNERMAPAPAGYEGIYSRPHETNGISYRLVNPSMSPKRMGVSLVTLEPNVKTTAGIHSHKSRESAYIVLEGAATMHLNGTEHQVKPNTVIFIPPGERHGIVSTGKTGVKFMNAWANLETTA